MNPLFSSVVFAAAKKTTSSSATTLIFVVVIVGALYFLFLRPRQKRFRVQREQTSTVDVGDGTVTFLFPDLVTSTGLWEEQPEAMRLALERHDAIVRAAIESHDGYVFSTGGDGFRAAFGRVSDALRGPSPGPSRCAAVGDALSSDLAYPPRGPANPAQLAPPPAHRCARSQPLEVASLGDG